MVFVNEQCSQPRWFDHDRQRRIRPGSRLDRHLRAGVRGGRLADRVVPEHARVRSGEGRGVKVLAEATGVVPLPPAEVMARLEERLSGGPYQMRFEVDRKRGMVAVQGGWWYRGEYYVSGDPAGTRVTHRVVNA